MLAVFAPAARWAHATVLAASALLLAVLFWVAGNEAVLQSAAQASRLARVSLGGGFWLLVVLAVLAAADAVQRLGFAPAARTTVFAVLLLPVAALLAGRRILTPCRCSRSTTNRERRV